MALLLSNSNRSRATHWISSSLSSVRTPTPSQRNAVKLHNIPPPGSLYETIETPPSREARLSIPGPKVPNSTLGLALCLRLRPHPRLRPLGFFLLSRPSLVASASACSFHQQTQISVVYRDPNRSVDCTYDPHRELWPEPVLCLWPCPVLPGELVSAGGQPSDQARFPSPIAKGNRYLRYPVRSGCVQALRRQTSRAGAAWRARLSGTILRPLGLFNWNLPHLETPETDLTTSP